VCPSLGVHFTLGIDAAGNVYVTGYSWKDTSSDFATIKYNSTGTQEWVATYNGPGNWNDYAVALATDGAGNVYVTGYCTQKFGYAIHSDYATVKYNSAGTQEWVAAYNGPKNGDDKPVALAVDGTGNVYVTGTNSGNRGDYATIKYNAPGIQQWVATYNGPDNGHDRAAALAVDGAGNIYVTGTTNWNGQKGNYATVKYNAAGTQQWIKVYNGPGNLNDDAVSIALDRAGDVYVTGSIHASSMVSDYMTVKYNGLGVQQWAIRHDEPGHADDIVTDMVVDSSGNTYVTGYSESDYLTVRYNAAGVQQWVARYNGSNNGYDAAVALGIDAAGNVYVTGSSSNGTSYDYVTIKYNAAGTQKWVATYDGPENRDDYAVALAVDRAGNIYVTGTSGTVKYNSAGVQQWVATYNGPPNYDYPVALAIDPASGDVYVTGIKWDGTSAAFATVKYNSAGAQKWMAIYNGPLNNDYPAALAIDPASGDVYVTGSSLVYYDEEEDDEYYSYAIIKYNSAGTEEWMVTYNGSGNDEPVALGIDAAGNIYVTGTSGINYDCATVKYNPTGVREWVATYNKPGRGYFPRALVVDEVGNVYVTGSSGGDYSTVKYNSAGTEEWRVFYNGPTNRHDDAVALAMDGNRNVYVAGSSVGSGTGYDFAAIKYIQIPIANAGPDKEICAGGSVSLGGSPTGTGGSGGPYTFKWTPTTGLNDPTAANPVASPATTTTYTVTVTETATGRAATDEVTITVRMAGWSVAYIVDADDVIFGLNQDAAPRDNRGLALSPDEQYFYVSYNNPTNRRLVRKIKLSESDPANNHIAVVAQLDLRSGAPANALATDDKGRVYLARPHYIWIYNSNLNFVLHTIDGFTNCEGVAVTRESSKLVVYATDRTTRLLKRFELAEGTDEAITLSTKTGLDGDGEVLIKDTINNIAAKSPRGVDVQNNGVIWVADVNAHRVFRFNPDGSSMASVGANRAMDVAIDETRGEVYVSQYTLRKIKVFDLNGAFRRFIIPPAADLKVDLDGAAGNGALSGLDVASCKRVFVANERGRSTLVGNPADSPFSNVGDNNDLKAADTDPVLVITGNVVSKESEGEESEEEVAVAEAAAVTSYELAQNYPNPFNPSTVINFALPEAAKVSLKIYDVAGQLVQTLVEGVVEAGRHQVVWDGTNQHGVLVASGVYFYQLRAGEFKQVRKMSLVR